MSNIIDDRGIKLCAYAGLAFIVLFLFGLVYAGLFPPLNPASSAQQIADYYRDNTNQVRTGLVILNICFCLYVAWIAGIISQVKKIGNVSNTYVYTLAGALITLAPMLLIVTNIWAAAAYRVERPDEIILALNDLAYIIIVWNAPILPVTYMAIGLATHFDTRENPVFPKWYAYFCYWSSLTALGSILIIFFHDTPWAWNGLIGLWVPATAFFGWYALTAYFVVINAYRKDLYPNC
jgi:hypothetical protein